MHQQFPLLKLPTLGQYFTLIFLELLTSLLFLCSSPLPFPQSWMKNENKTQRRRQAVKQRNESAPFETRKKLEWIRNKYWEIVPWVDHPVLASVRTQECRNYHMEALKGWLCLPYFLPAFPLLGWGAVRAALSGLKLRKLRGGWDYCIMWLCQWFYGILQAFFFWVRICTSLSVLEIQLTLQQYRFELYGSLTLGFFFSSTSCLHIFIL